MKKGDIVLIPFPFTDLSGLKNRPALILAVGEADVTVSFMTTQLKWQEDFDVKIEPMQTNGLKKTSLIRLFKLATIDKDLVLGKLGELSDEELKKVDNVLVDLFQLRHLQS
ncbi:type II toxin-antitoxin system PemK/MazF family toxin [Arenibacter sp. GZD96]|uniref:type II toxin-antitoxin system PemK/MazF family toxin n=1 Tax=Aurantibrevibacter litoralis TaxID=3106030 RepID=UPI002AFEF24A|nr:type II toxin-antitoxin system PemK/MazF family toxin [Arenibacter sp. GZD-96]MEA1785281.1 type II toxin-antitoxin system PemK/MazF family toxin [Arenibacter sp. GZD-96]